MAETKLDNIQQLCRHSGDNKRQQLQGMSYQFSSGTALTIFKTKKEFKDNRTVKNNWQDIAKDMAEYPNQSRQLTGMLNRKLMVLKYAYQLLQFVSYYYCYTFSTGVEAFKAWTNLKDTFRPLRRYMKSDPEVDLQLYLSPLGSFGPS